MQTIIQQWVETGDRRSMFLRCYWMMTCNVATALEAGEFGDPAWVRALLCRFADYYFDALDAYEQHSPATPPVWQTVHDATRNPQTAPLQRLVLGVNAHINYDLVLTLVDLLQPEWAALTPEMRQQRHHDHRHVNDVIGATIDSVQDQILEPLEPGLDVVDKLLGRVDEWLISRLITHWREDVWENAQAMLAIENSREREVLRQEIEAATQRKSAAILLQGGLSGWKALFELRPAT
jgi:hypothetical protein